MTRLLEKVFAEAEKLPELEQNVLAKWLLNEIAAEKRWDKAFAESENVLEKLSEEGLREHKQKKTKLLDPERLWSLVRQNGSAKLLPFFQNRSATKPIYSVRINAEYRAIGIQNDNEIVWLWIGSHDDYIKLLARF